MARIINRAQGLSIGLNPLAYMGVQGASSNNTVVPLVVFNVNPNNNDWQNFSLLTVWLNSTTKQVWFLVSLEENQATWVEVTAGSGSVLSVVTDVGTALPVAGVISLLGTPNAGHSVSFSASGNVINLNTSDANNNTFVGIGTGSAITSGAANTALGAFALHLVTSGSNNTAIGLDSLQNLTTGSSNTALGLTSGQDLISGSTNTLIGYESGTNLTTGSNNIGLGQSSAGSYTTESNNVTIANTGVPGDSAVLRIGNSTTPFTHTFINNTYSDIGIANTFVGSNAGGVLNVGAGTGTNTALGSNALASISQGGLGSNGNVAIGSNALASYTFSTTAPYTGDNTAVGLSALQALTTGGVNTAIGYASLLSATTGNANTALGGGSGSAITTGSFNVLIGEAAGTNGSGVGFTTGSNNIVISTLSQSCLYTSSESSNILIYNSGVNAESNVIRIGTSGSGSSQQNKCFIAGIRGITTGVANAIAVLIDSNGQLGTVSSSARYKDDIEDMGKESDVLYNLRPVTFDYKAHNSRYRSVGLIAEEVHDVAPRFVVYDEDGRPETVKYHDLVPMLLNELQKLAKRVEELEAR